MKFPKVNKDKNKKISQIQYYIDFIQINYTYMIYKNKINILLTVLHYKYFLLKIFHQ